MGSVVVGGDDGDVGGGDDAGGGWDVPGDGAGAGAGAGGGEETETVGATNCVRPGIWVVSRWRPLPAAALAGETVDAALIPATALPAVLAADDKVVGEEGLPVAIVVSGALVVSVDDPSAARPVAAIETLPVLDV